MRMNFIKFAAGFGLALALVACGGGGGSSGTPSGAPSTSASSPVVTVVPANFIFSFDKSSISNGGSDAALLTVTVLDAARNILADVPVSVSVDSGVYTPVATKSDATGQVTGNISIGADKRNRTINVTMTVGTMTKTASVVVTGSRISVAALNATPQPGEIVTLNVSAYDSANIVIPNVEVNLSGTAGLTGSVNTGVSGTKIVTFLAPSNAGPYTVVADGLGVKASQSIQVIAGVGSIPNAVGDVSSASLTPDPTSIAPNTAGSAVNRARLSAKFLTANNVGIENMRVRFELVTPLLGNGESISTGSGTVYTSASGLAEADYIPGTRSSPTNGVSLRACYSAVNFTSVTDCPSFVVANLTVAGSSLGISIGTDNTMEKGLGGIAYLKKFLIQVNDAAGVAVKDAVVSASVDITHYGKGSNWASPYINIAVPSIRDFHSDYLPPSSPVNAVQSLPPSTYVPKRADATVTPVIVGEKIWCINEDWNRNGSLDMGEDINRDGIIQPRKAEIVVSYVSSNKTDANGQLLVQISYPQNMGRWLAYTVRATTSVAGSEGDASRSFVTDVLEGDVANGSFLTPPFGTNSCTSVF